ncbi:MAG: metallophosphoesterase [Thermoproteota archaeon]|nr:metallophosphoesterase [Candidatus Brockarchaeota archaeon]
METAEKIKNQSKEEVERNIKEVTAILEKEQNLIEVEAEKVVFVGDTHGDLSSTLSAFSKYENAGYKMIFLGDYVDRGEYQIENINFLISKKLEKRSEVILLRGNHETEEMNKAYGFLREVIKRYGLGFYELYMKLFSSLPYAVVVNKKFIALHGGLARNLNSLDNIRELEKGETNPRGMAMEILWNDPIDFIEGFESSDRGPGIYYFGKDVLDKFLEENKLKALIRSHEPRANGVSIEMGGKLYVVFSCRYYGIKPGALVLNDDKLSSIRL